jgi:Ni/Fe-hydrogenase subunit HybB-like protein
MTEVAVLKVLVAILFAVIASFACRLLARLSVRAVSSPRCPLWTVLIALWCAGGYLLAARLAGNSGAITNIRGDFPWSIWISFDLFVGTALAAGGFLLAGLAPAFGVKSLNPLLPPAVLIALLGYLLGLGAVVIELGRPSAAFQPAFFIGKVVFRLDTTGCLLLYTLALLLAVPPQALKLHVLRAGRRISRLLVFPVIVAAVFVSPLHESSIASLFALIPERQVSLWHSPFLPIFCLVSPLTLVAAVMNLAAPWIFPASASQSNPQTLRILTGGVIALSAVALLFRTADVTLHGAWRYTVVLPVQGLSFLAEMLLFAFLLVLVVGRWRKLRSAHSVAAVSAVLAIILHRLNVGWIGLLPSSATGYYPSWQEVVLAPWLESFIAVLFFLAVMYAPGFVPRDHREALSVGPPAPSGQDLRHGHNSSVEATPCDFLPRPASP